MHYIIITILLILLYLLFIRFLSHWKPARRWFYEAAFVILSLFLISPYSRTLTKMIFEEQVKYVPQGIMDKTLETLIYQKTGMIPQFMLLDLPDSYSAYIVTKSDGLQVVLTSGLIKILNKKQIAFVILHEIEHYGSNHHQLRIIIWISMFVVFLGCSRIIFILSRNAKVFNQGLRLAILYSLVILFTFPPVHISRQHEISADRQAAIWMGESGVGIETLNKLKYLNSEKINPFRQFFSQHPTHSERIESLQKLY